MKQAQQIAQEWVNAWNAHDLDAIMAHYAEDVELWSPLVVQRLGLASGKVEGKSQLQTYFAKGLEASKDLHFTLIQVFAGVDSVTLHYRRHDGIEVAEMMVIDAITHQITSVRVHRNAL